MRYIGYLDWIRLDSNRLDWIKGRIRSNQIKLEVGLRFKLRSAFRVGLRLKCTFRSRFRFRLGSKFRF